MAKTEFLALLWLVVMAIIPGYKEALGCQGHMDTCSNVGECCGMPRWSLSYFIA